MANSLNVSVIQSPAYSGCCAKSEKNFIRNSERGVTDLKILIYGLLKSQKFTIIGSTKVREIYEPYPNMTFWRMLRCSAVITQI